MAAPTTPHPLSPLTAEEISAARDQVLARVADPEGVRFGYLGLCEPTKEAVRAADRVRRSPRTAGSACTSSRGPRPT